MTSKEIKNAIKYWLTTSERDYGTMLALFKAKRYPESLFFGHIVLEKVLKGLVVKESSEQPPYTHDLVRLASLAKSGLSYDDIKFLKMVNGFNIRARYPEYRLKIYKEYKNKSDTEKVFKRIETLRENLCQKLK